MKINNPVLKASEQIRNEEIIDDFISKNGEEFVYKISGGKNQWELLPLEAKTRLISWYTGSWGKLKDIQYTNYNINYKFSGSVDF